MTDRHINRLSHREHTDSRWVTNVGTETDPIAAGRMTTSDTALSIGLNGHRMVRENVPQMRASLEKLALGDGCLKVRQCLGREAKVAHAEHRQPGVTPAVLVELVASPPVVDGLPALLFGATATLGPGLAGQSIQASNATTSRPPPADRPISNPRFPPDEDFPFDLPFLDAVPRYAGFFPLRDGLEFAGDSASKSSSAESPKSHSSSDESALGFGTLIACWHDGHFTRRPASSSLTESFLPHAHETVIAVTR